jgi:hypothetical protein
VTAGNDPFFNMCIALLPADNVAVIPLFQPLFCR